jgi:Lar family restriction alleviation protein
MPDKLKPCPFCNGEVTNYHIEHLDLNHRKFDYRCEKCGAYFSLPNTAKYLSAEQTEKEMVKVWNRRADNDR